MKRIVAGIAALALFLVPINSLAAVKPGATCSKSGAISISKNKKYICVKSGKKLIWNKGVVIIAPKPQPTPTPSAIATPSPSPTDSPVITPSASPSPVIVPAVIPKTFNELFGNSEGVAIAAWNSTNDKIKKSSPSSIRQDIYVGPNTTVPNTQVKEIFENASRIFAGYAQPQSFFAIYYRFQDKDWAKAKLIDLNQPNRVGEVDGSCGSLTRCNGASAGKASSTVGFSQYAVAEPGAQTDAYHLDGGLEIHEFTHIAQAMQFIGKKKDDQNFEYLPRWFIEGHAHIAGITGSAKTLEEYQKNRRNWLNTSPNQEIRSFFPEDIERFYSSLMPGKYNSEMFGYVYTIGFITMESLVALKGIDSPTEVIVEVSNGLSFEEAFAKVYGLTWAEAAPILAKSVSQQFLSAN